MTKDEATSFRLSKKHIEKMDSFVSAGIAENRSEFVRKSIDTYGIAKQIVLYSKPSAPPTSLKDKYLTLGDYSDIETMKYLQSKLIKPTPDNIKFAWGISVEIQSVVHTIIQTIQKGEWQFQVTPDKHPQKETIEQILNTMMRHIDFHDFIEEAIVSLAKFGNAVFNVQVNQATKELTEFGLIDYSDLRAMKNPTKPLMQFLYKVGTDPEMPEDPEAFISYDTIFPYSEFTTYHLIPLEYSLKNRQLFDAVNTKWMEGSDEDRIYHCIHIKYRGSGYEVGESPIGLVINKIVNKMLLEHFAPMIAEKYGNPILRAKQELISITGPNEEFLHNFPKSEDKKAALEDEMDTMLQALVDMKAMGAIAAPLGWDVDVLTPASGIYNFAELLRYLKGEIMLSFLASLSLFDITEAHALAASKTLKTVWDDVIDSFRRKLEKTFQQQVIPFVLWLQGIDLIEHPELEVLLQISPYTVPWASVDEAISLVSQGMITIDEWRERYNLPEIADAVVKEPVIPPEDIDEAIDEEPEFPYFQEEDLTPKPVELKIPSEEK